MKFYPVQVLQIIIIVNSLNDMLWQHGVFGWESSTSLNDVGLTLDTQVLLCLEYDIALKENLASHYLICVCKTLNTWLVNAGIALYGRY